MSSDSRSLIPLLSASANRRASHCSGVTGMGGRPRKQATDAPGRFLEGCARRRLPTDSEGAEVARFHWRPNGPASELSGDRQVRRGVKFTADDHGRGDLNTDSGASDASSADDGHTHGERRRHHALELPALPGVITSASAKGGSSGSTTASGPAGVTLAFLETLSAASRPGTTLRELYFSLVLPTTRATRCAYVSLLGTEHRARPTHVVVCSWDERISDIVDCVVDHISVTTTHLGGVGGGRGGRLSRRRSVEYATMEHSAGQAASWTFSGAPGMPGHATSNCSRSPSPRLSPGPSPATGSGSFGADPPPAVWLDLFAVNFHPPAATSPAAAGRLSLSAKLSPLPSLEDAAVERARALPSAVASTLSVVLLPGAQGAGLREPAVTLAAWHALRGRGCEAVVALSVAAPVDVDIVLLQAAFEGLAVSATKVADEGAYWSGGALGAGGAESGPGIGNRPSSPTNVYASPDRVAVRAVREGAAGAAIAAAAAAAIYAADPLPSRTVREGLAAAATAAANALLGRPVGFSTGRPSALRSTMSLPPTPLPPGSPLLQPSTPQLLSPTPSQTHSAWQTRSFSVSALESQSHLPSPLSSSRLSTLPVPLRSGSAAGAASNARPLLMAAGRPPTSTTMMMPAVGTASPPIPSPTSGPLLGPTAAVAHCLLRMTSGRSVSFNSLTITQAGKQPDDDDSNAFDDSSDAGGTTNAVSKDSHTSPLDGGGIVAPDRRARDGISFSGICGSHDMARGGWAAAASVAMGAGAAHDIGGEMPTVGRRPRIAPLDVFAQSAPPPSVLPPALSPSFADHATGGNSGRFMHLRNSAVAPWEASSPLPLVPSRSPSGPGGVPTGSDGGSVTPGALHHEGATVPLHSPPPPPPPLPPLPPPGLLSLAPRSLLLEPSAPLSQPLPRLAPLQLHGSPLPWTTQSAATVAIADAAAGVATGGGAASVDAASAPLPVRLQCRDIASAAAIDTVEAGGLLVTPFVQVRKTQLHKDGDLLRGRSGRGMGASTNSLAANLSAIGTAGSGAAVRPGRDPYQDTPSDPDPNPGVASSGSEGGAIVLETLKRFLTDEPRDNFESRNLHQPASEMQLHSASGNGCSGGVAGDGQPQLRSFPSGVDAGTVVGADFRSSLPCPDCPSPHDLAPYRPLPPDLARLVGTGRLLAALGQQTVALRVVRYSMTSARSFHGSNHPDTARCAAALGQLMVHFQQQQQSQGLMGLGLGGPESGGFGSSAAHCGKSPPRAAAYAEARDRLETAVIGGSGGGHVHGRPASPVRTRIGTASLSPTASSLPSDMAAGPLEEAEALLRGASAVLERFLGPDTEETLAARQGLAAVLMAGGRFDEAIPVLQRAALSRGARRRPVSEVVIESGIDLAKCLAATCRTKEARKLLRAQLLRLNEDEDEAAAAAATMTRSGRASGGNTPGVLFPLGNTSSSHSNLTFSTSGGVAMMPLSSSASAASLFAIRPPYSNGDVSTAARSFAAVSNGVSGFASPVSGGAGGVQAKSTIWMAAAAASPHLYSQRGLTPLKREELRAKCTYQLAGLKASCGKAQAARILYRRAVQGYAAVYGITHVVTAGCMLKLADLNHSLWEYSEALELYHTVLELYVDMYGPYHPATTRVSNRMGELEEEMEEAVQEEEEAEAARREPGRVALSHSPQRGSMYRRRNGLEDEDSEEDEEEEQLQEPGVESGLGRLGSLAEASWIGHGKSVFGLGSSGLG